MKRQVLSFGALLLSAVFFPSRANAQSSAVCDGSFHFVYVRGAVNLDGSETGFEYLCQTGSANGPLLFYLSSGGACWTGDNCDCQPNSLGQCTNPNTPNLAQSFYNKSTSDDGLPWSQTYWGGAGDALASVEGAGAPPAAAFAGPTSPFNQNWNIVFIPYVTGDAHIGDAVRELTTSSGKTYTAYFKGYRNITHDLTVIHSLFPSPSKIAIWGASAGGVGADCNLSQFRANWPTTSMWELSSSGPAYGTDNLMPLFPGVTQIWGAWASGPGGAIIVGKTCPINPGTGSTDWSLEWVVGFNANTFQSVRKALTDDYSDRVVSFFACLIGATPDPNGSCADAVASTLTDEFNEVISRATNYKVFYHTGTCHAERESDGNTVANGSNTTCNFDRMQQSGVMFNDWVNAWINNSPAWVNVR